MQVDCSPRLMVLLLNHRMVSLVCFVAFLRATVGREKKSDIRGMSTTQLRQC